ncbi:MAG: DMT family transporter [Thalassobaculales bacterium]
MTATGAAGPPPGRGSLGAWVLLAGVVLVWGWNWPVMKTGLAHIGPFWFGVVRCWIGAACLFGVLLATGGRTGLPDRQDWPIVAIAGLFQMAAFLVLVHAALLLVGAGRAAVIAYTTPLWVVPGAVWLLGERLTAAKALGVALGLAGLLALFNPFTFAWSDGGQVLGNALLLLAALCWAVAILAIRRHRFARPVLELTPWQLLLASLPLLPLALLLEGAPPANWPAPLLFAVFYNGPLATAFCYWATVVIARDLPAMTSAVGFQLVPVMGVAASAIVLDEALGPELLAGMALVAAGMILATRPGRA